MAIGDFVYPRLNENWHLAVNLQFQNKNVHHRVWNKNPADNELKNLPNDTLLQYHFTKNICVQIFLRLRLAMNTLAHIFLESLIYVLRFDRTNDGRQMIYSVFRYLKISLKTPLLAHENELWGFFVGSGIIEISNCWNIV